MESKECRYSVLVAVSSVSVFFVIYYIVVFPHHHHHPYTLYADVSIALIAVPWITGNGS